MKKLPTNAARRGTAQKSAVVKNHSPKISIALSDIRSAHNVGSAFRTSDAAGVSEIFLCGYTPAPKDRFGRAESGAQKDIAKVALGAEKTIFWQVEEDAVGLIRRLQKRGAFVVAIEQAPSAISIRKIGEKIAAQMKSAARAGKNLAKKQKEVAFVFGNETKGLPERILKVCDEIAFIPMKGNKESLNVSVALGIALYIALDI